MDHPFKEVPPTAAQHFKLFFYSAIVGLLQRVPMLFQSAQDAFERFPFLAGYNNELAAIGLEGVSLDEASDRWKAWLWQWEQEVTAHLPLRALADAAALEYDSIRMILTAGLIEEDVRFGAVFEEIQGTPGQHRPIVGLLSAWSGDESFRYELYRMIELGLLRPTNPDAPRVEWALQVPAPIWDALRGELLMSIGGWISYRAPESLLSLDELVLADEVRRRLSLIPELLSADEVQAVVIRGPQRNGRRTVAGALARALDKGLLEVIGITRADDERWKLVGPLSTLTGAVPAIVLEVPPGETVDVPALAGYQGPLTVVMGRHGGIAGPRVERALSLKIEMPDWSARRAHWLAELGDHSIADVDVVSQRFRLTSGNIRRAAQLASAYAALAEREQVTLSDVQQASKTLNRQTLETLATKVETSGDWSSLAVGGETLRELYNLEARCRHRERLRESVSRGLGAQLNAGVRALFAGQSGTGKTLAARILASVLEMDLYRLDLSAVVNKYIGETEKSLNQIFSRAEELDVILLIDEGDALLTQRTGVQTSNDRYANLETNYLLQRLEGFEGILIVTTNAAERIDRAFQRRIDVVVDFRAPEAAERLAIWELHLPSSHQIGTAFLREVASRCAMSGGQIRNAVLHASLLALQNGGIVKSDYLESAVQREYRKAGAVCPLRRPSPLAIARR